jgi:hypothetical protein
MNLERGFGDGHAIDCEMATLPQCPFSLRSMKRGDPLVHAITSARNGGADALLLGAQIGLVLPLIGEKPLYAR